MKIIQDDFVSLLIKSLNDDAPLAKAREIAQANMIRTGMTTDEILKQLRDIREGK